MAKFTATIRMTQEMTRADLEHEISQAEIPASAHVRASHYQTSDPRETPYTDLVFSWEY